MNKKNTDNTNTDALIGKLCGDLKPTGPRCPYRRVSVWLLCSLIYLAVVVYVTGLRPDLADRLYDSRFLFDIFLGTAILLTSSLASSWLSFPDCFQRHWMKTIPVSLFTAFLLWVVAQSIEQGEGLISTFHAGHCAGDGMVMQLLPIIALVIITMKGHTTQPYWSMAMNILAVSTLGWIGLKLTCSMDMMGHTLLNHILPFAIIGAGLGFFARKLFKW